MSVAHKRKRRNFFNQPSHQLRFSITILGYIVIYLFILFTIILLPSIVSYVQPQASMSERLGSYELVSLFLPKFFLAFIITVVIAFFHAIIISHRIFGPLTRFASVRTGVVKGGLYQRIKLRENDLIGTMPDDFNAIIESYDTTIYEIKEMLSKIESSAIGVENRELRENIDKLKSKLSKYATTHENS